MNATTALIKTKALIRDKGWTQGYGARDIDGNRVMVDDPDAASFCMTGALSIIFNEDIDAYSAAYDRLCEATYPTGLTIWNDTHGRTKEEVLEAFDRAIAAGD